MPPHHGAGGDTWYIVREFIINGQRVLSRQAWRPETPDRVVRVSERSTDGGTTWQLRFREEYAQIPPAAAAPAPTP